MSDDSDRLKKYEKKRDFSRTTEPRGSEKVEKKRSSDPVFVIQLHDATRLHYDFRLEVEGVLKSWAVPKGPSTDPADRRLAMETEDHPLEYAEFEGVIPEGNYGAGPVLVWDQGTYRNLKAKGDRKHRPRTMQQAYEEGHLSIWLEGQKLKGAWSLIRTKGGDDRAWLLIKKKDEESDARRNPTSTEPESVKTGRTLEDVLSDEKAGESKPVKTDHLEEDEG